MLVETSNILRRLERAGEISRLEAASAYRDLLRLDLTLFPFAPFAECIWELRSSLTSYDAWYVALAEALGGPLVTLDAKLGPATGPKCEIIVPPRPHERERARFSGNRPGLLWRVLLPVTGFRRPPVDQRPSVHSIRNSRCEVAQSLR